MKEFIAILLQAVTIAAVSICAAAIVKGVQAFARYISARVDSDTAKTYLSEVSAAISTAVTYTSQTYVDRLKDKNAFDKESQKQALETAVDKTRSLLTAEAVMFLEKAYGDLNAYLTTLIEAEVRNQKNEAPVMLGLPAPESSTDATAVAASTAAATAATLAQADKVMQTAITQLTEQFASAQPESEQTT